MLEWSRTWSGSGVPGFTGQSAIWPGSGGSGALHSRASNGDRGLHAPGRGAIVIGEESGGSARSSFHHLHSDTRSGSGDTWPKSAPFSNPVSLNLDLLA